MIADPRPQHDPVPTNPDDPNDRRRILIAATVLGGVLLFFALLALLMFLFRWQILPDPWKVI